MYNSQTASSLCYENILLSYLVVIYLFVRSYTADYQHKFSATVR